MPEQSNVNAAIALLIEAVDDDARTTAEELQGAVARDAFAEARRLIDRAESLRRARNAAMELKAELSRATKGRARPASKAPRPARRRNLGKLQPGESSPRSVYVIPILRTLAVSGGAAPAGDVLDALGRDLLPTLMPTDRDPLASGEPRWRKTASWARVQMDLQGLVTSPERGIWKITDAGISHLSRVDG